MDMEAENVRVYWVSCALWLAHRLWGCGLAIGQFCHTINTSNLIHSKFLNFFRRLSWSRTLSE